MTAERWSRVQALYLEAEALPGDARAEFLDGACGGDAALRAEVEALLKTSQETRSVFERPDAILPGEPAVPPLAAGTRLGPWSIEHLVGRGGMGEVYEAKRADGAFELRVAIKLLKRGLDSEAVVARFTRERRILAQLDHPNIAHVLDAGVAPDGRPFLAMEYVEGKPITEYAPSQELPTHAVLQLMIAVCEAVQAAHAKRIVHRDLKPSNVLVTPQGQVKLLDFGIAKALAEEDADATQLAGESMALTPAYAAPEQILGQAASPASDVYALGVILYQLLVERLPHRRGGRSTTEIALGLNQETVERPSTALRKERGRMSEPQRLERLHAASKDLDLIVLKALHAEADRRYASAQECADDLRCLLDHRPVLARPDSVSYRFGRFVRRNRLAVSAAAAVIVALSVGLAASLWQAQRAQHQAALATATKDFLLSMFKASDPRIASDKPRGEITAKELLDLGSARIEKEFSGQPELQIELLGLTADIYEGLADEERYAALQKRRIELARAHYGLAHPIVLQGLLSDAQASIFRQDYTKAGQLLTEVDPLLTSSGQDRSLLRAGWWGLKSWLLFSSGGSEDEMIRALDKSLALYQQLAPHSSDYARLLALAATIYSRRDDDVRERRFNEQALSIIEAAPNRNDSAMHNLLDGYARNLEALGEFAAAESAYERAEELARKTWGERHGQYWLTLAHHARMLHRRGEREPAHALFLQMLRAIPPDWKTDNVDALARGLYAECLAAEGQAREAIPLLEATLRSYLERDYAGRVPLWRLSLGDAYDRAGRTEDARGMLKSALEQILSKRPDSKKALGVRVRWGHFLMDHSKPGDADFAAAESEFRTVLEKSADRLWIEPALAHAGLARIAAAHGDTTTALNESSRALAALDRAQDLDVRVQPQLWLVHSAVLLQSNDTAGARQWAEKALDASRRYDDPSAPSIAKAEAALHAAMRP